MQKAEAVAVEAAAPILFPPVFFSYSFISIYHLSAYFIDKKGFTTYRGEAPLFCEAPCHLMPGCPTSGKPGATCSVHAVGATLPRSFPLSTCIVQLPPTPHEAHLPATWAAWLHLHPHLPPSCTCHAGSPPAVSCLQSAQCMQLGTFSFHMHSTGSLAPSCCAALTTGAGEEGKSWRREREPAAAPEQLAEWQLGRSLWLDSSGLIYDSVLIQT